MLSEQYRQKENSYFCRFTFGQFFTLLVIEIFSLFFIFYLGARYGRELLGIETPQIPPPVAQGGFPTLQTTDPNSVFTMHDPEIQALAKEILDQAPSPELKQRVADMLERNQAPAAPAAPPKIPAVLFAKPQTSPEEVSAPKEIAEPKEIPAPKVEPKVEKAQSSAKPSMGKPPVIQTNPFRGHFSVQVGSYPNVDEAYAILDDWKSKGYPAFVVSADIPDKGRWYRIRLGGFDSKEEAKSYLDELTSKENIEAFIAPNE